MSTDSIIKFVEHPFVHLRQRPIRVRMHSDIYQADRSLDLFTVGAVVGRMGNFLGSTILAVMI